MRMVGLILGPELSGHPHGAKHRIYIRSGGERLHPGQPQQSLPCSSGPSPLRVSSSWETNQGCQARCARVSLSSTSPVLAAQLTQRPAGDWREKGRARTLQGLNEKSERRARADPTSRMFFGFWASALLIAPHQARCQVCPVLGDANVLLRPAASA